MKPYFVYKVVTTNSDTEYYVKCQEIDEAVRVAIAEETQKILALTLEEIGGLCFLGVPGRTLEERKQERIANLGIDEAGRADAKIFDLKLSEEGLLGGS